MQHADCIKYHVPIIPQSVKASGLLTTRKNLPTWGHREEILNMINNNKVGFSFIFLSGQIILILTFDRLS